MASPTHKSAARRLPETSRLSRSSSFNAIPRTTQQRQFGNDSSELFSNKRDNPLFWSTSSPENQSQDETGQSVSIKSINDIASNDCKGSNMGSGSNGNNEKRGRSVVRNSGGNNGIGRSVSRVRSRSVSRGHHGSYQSQNEQETVLSSDARRNHLKQNKMLQERPITANARGNQLKQVGPNVRKPIFTRSGSDNHIQVKNSQKTRSQIQPTECSSDESPCSIRISNSEDGISSSFSEAEDKTADTVSEQMEADQWASDATSSGIYETVRSEVRRAICDIQSDIESTLRRSNVSPTEADGVADATPDLVSPEAADPVLDIRRKCAAQLDESEERARKLRADLAIEEHRAHEIGRILRESTPEPKVSSTQRSQKGRRSCERKRMSRRLAEEALTYFDECVSISTFDSSDFSPAEDPPQTVRAPICVGNSVSLSGGAPSTLCSYEGGSSFNQKQVIQSDDNSVFTINKTCDEHSACQKGDHTRKNHLYRFSFAHEQPEDIGSNQEFRSCVKHFSKGIDKDINSNSRTPTRDFDEYCLQDRADSLLFDKVLLNNRIESGSLLLCDGGGIFPFAPFSSII